MYASIKDKQAGVSVEDHQCIVKRLVKEKRYLAVMFLDT
jgi:hypothetical protein